MDDTHPRVRALRFELLRRFTAARRFALANELTRAAVSWSRRAVRRTMPGAPASDVLLRWVEPTYGSGSLDEGYLDRWAAELGLGDLLGRAWARAPVERRTGVRSRRGPRSSSARWNTPSRRILVLLLRLGDPDAVVVAVPIPHEHRTAGRLGDLTTIQQIAALGQFLAGIGQLPPPPWTPLLRGNVWIR